MTQLQTHLWAQETEAVLKQARRAITESRTESVAALAEKLPDKGSSSNAPISLAFAGQYSAGKSTLIKALTGRDDIAVGAGITTETIQHYVWRDVTVIDTPGIHTALRPDHDHAAYSSISNSDLLVFVITNELFDSHIADYYRKLTIDREKGHETILVVNKMGRHAMGNTPASRAVIREDLREPLQPFTPEDLRITFTDAASALEASEETDPEFREMLLRQGNLDELIDNLNSLVVEKGLNARHTTALYSIDEVLQTAIQMEPTDDPDVDALVLVYNQNIRAINETRQQLHLAVSNAIAQGTDQIRAVGADLAEQFYPDVKRDQMERAELEAQSRVEDLTRQIAAETEQLAAEILPTLGQRLEDLQGTSLHRNTFDAINSRMQGRDLGPAIRGAASGATKLGELARGFAFNSGAVARGASGLAQYSGSTAHGAILNVGHFLGHSFRPWEAVRMASFIGRAAPFLTIAGAVLSVGAQAYADHQEDKRSREMQGIRQDIRAQFVSAGIEIGDRFNIQWKTIMSEMLDDPLEQIIEQRDELNRLREEQNAHLAHLNSVSTAANNLIHRIHSVPAGQANQ